MTIQITIVGLGQIGGSIGLALSEKQDLLHRVGHDKEHIIAQQAKKMNAVDSVSLNLPNAVENADVITFPQATGGSETATTFVVGTVVSGAGKILYSGALTAGLAISNGITPEFAAGELDVTED